MGFLTMRYIIIDEDGAIINAVEWDGRAQWSPPEGCTAVRSDMKVGGTYKNRTYTPPLDAEPGEPSLEARVRKIEEQLGV